MVYQRLSHPSLPVFYLMFGKIQEEMGEVCIGFRWINYAKLKRLMDVYVLDP